MTEPPVLALEQVSRRFGDVVAADQVSFEVARGEFFSLLGPSGCGKTTTLRLIAGFEEPDPDGGTVRMLGQVMNGRRPYQRPIGMVFQNYALFPHLRVAENIAFGLEEQRVPRDEITRRVNRTLELVRLDPAIYARRRPAELSGGQRQRVALARALVLEPPILLLDEPLGALDLQLRKAMQLELKDLNRTLGITFVLVTHDQDEALAMSDRIAVMHRGRVAQVGTPAAIYETPRTPFVAEFIGEANLFAGVVEQVEQGLATVMGRDGVRWQVPVAPGVTNGTPLQIAVRPEWQVLSREQDGRPAGNAVAGVVTSILFRGETLHVLVSLADGRVVRVALRNQGARGNPMPWSVGERVLVSWAPRDAQVLER